MKRCFLAVKFQETEQYVDQINLISKNLNVRLKITKSENYHFTLHFFGDIDETQEETLIQHFEEFTFSPFTLVIGRTMSFPNNRLNKTRVLGVQPTKGRMELIELQSKIAKELSTLGFKPDNRSYSPHLTISRIKSGEDIYSLTKTWLDSELYEEKILIDHFSLYQSTLTKTGSIYQILSDFKF